MATIEFEYETKDDKALVYYRGPDGRHAVAECANDTYVIRAVTDGFIAGYNAKVEEIKQAFSEAYSWSTYPSEKGEKDA